MLPFPICATLLGHGILLPTRSETTDPTWLEGKILTLFRPSGKSIFDPSCFLIRLGSVTTSQEHRWRTKKTAEN